MEREIGQHTFWRGSLWGRTVALQGDSSFTKYDLFEVTGTGLLYWGTFRGNGYYGSEESHSFSSPFVWMDPRMSVGDFKQQRVSDSLLDPQLRRTTNSDELTLRVELVAHYDSWRDPDSQLLYQDVLEVHYWGRYPEPTSLEVYHLGRGLGTIRFESKNRQEPSGVHYQYAESFERYTPPDAPALPWFDPFNNRTYVRNGFCEDFLIPPAQGGAVGELSARLVRVEGRGDHDRRRRRGNESLEDRAARDEGGGDAEADFVISSDYIPVVPGRRYRLSGSLWRVSAADNVYLDFNDGAGQGGSFPDAQAMARATQVWERVFAETTVGPTTTGIKVRCVRDGANAANAYCDGITLQRVD